MIDEQKNVIVPNVTCFTAHAEHDVTCNRQQCQHWIMYPTCQNCVLIAVQRGPHTLQEIGKIYNLTRMRICQIEKNIRNKIKHAC